MGDFNKQICRLCLVMSPTCKCETIDGIKKEILQVLQINIDFDISNNAVACNSCLKRLQDCFDYKSHIITTLMDDIKKTSQSEMIGENLCQLCMSLIKEEAFNYTTDLKGADLLKDMIKDCFPEVDIQEPLVCKQCIRGLETHYEFMKNCQEVEQKIVHFCQVANHCTADKVNLDDMLKFKYDDIPGASLFKKKCSDADGNAAKRTEREDIADIKCEEIYIKDEVDNGAEQSGSYQIDDNDNLGEKNSSKRKRKVKSCKPGEKKYVCPKCPYSTEWFNNFKKHLHTHSVNKQRRCTLCSFVTDARLLLQDHMTTHKGATKNYGCPECSYEADRKGRLEQHIMTHKDVSEVEMHKCPLCPFQSKYKSKVGTHQKLQHNESIQMHKCPDCSYSTKYKWNLVAHNLTHEVNKFKCKKCQYCTKWQGHLRSHMKNHHKQ